MSYKNLNGLTATEQHYLNLSEVYHAVYLDHTISSKKIMVCQGILVKMYGELIEFQLKNKSTDKTMQREVELKKLMEIVAEFSKIADTNYTMKLRINANVSENQKLREENQKLKDELDSIKKAWNST